MFSSRMYNTYRYGYPYMEADYERHPSAVFFRLESPEEELNLPQLHISDRGYQPERGRDFAFPVFPVYAAKNDIPQELRCLPLLEVSAAVQIESTIAKTTLTQRFQNPSTTTIKEGTYSFPLYDGSAVVAFRCLIGEDKLLEGEIKPKAQAKAVYEKAVAEQQTAALLNEHSPEVFEARLGNIAAKTTVKVEIVYVHELKADLGGEAVQLTIPTSIAPRYGSAPNDYSSSTANVSHAGLSISVDVTASVPIRRLESSSHPISVEMGWSSLSTSVASFGELALTSETTDHDPKRARATLSDRNTVLGKDFVLLILATGSSMLRSQALLEPRPSSNGEAAMVVTLNPRDLLASKRQGDEFRGEVIFLADRSGSMLDRSKMPTLRDALKLFLKSLPLDCYFNIGSFGTSFSLLWPVSRLYTQESLDEAMEHISPSFDANMGGTEILPALKDTVKSRNSEQCTSTQIILLTDGEVWNTEETSEFVRKTRQGTGGKVRFFALGIGDAVSHRLIEGIGTGGGGFGEVVVLDNQGRWDERIIRMLKGALMPPSWDCEITFPEAGLEGLSADTGYAGTHQRSDVATGDSEPFESGFERPTYISAPFKNPSLHPFARHSVFFLLDSKAGPLPDVVTINATISPSQNVSLTLPVNKTRERTSAIHHLAAKATMLDLEAGSSWLHSKLQMNDLDPDTIEIKVKKEAERLGSLYGITGRWTSFVAVDQSNRRETSTRSYKAKRCDLELLTQARNIPSASTGVLATTNAAGFSTPQNAFQSESFADSGTNYFKTPDQNFNLGCRTVENSEALKIFDNAHSWTNNAAADDDWTVGFTAKKDKKKNKKGADDLLPSVPDPPGSSAFQDISLGDTALKLEFSFGGFDRKDSAGFGARGKTWDFGSLGTGATDKAEEKSSKKDNDKKESSTDFGDNNPWSFGNKSKKKTTTFGTGFDFGDFDAGGNTGFSFDVDGAETKAADEAWGFSAVNKKDKKKKGALEGKKDEEPAPVEPEPKEEEPWSAWGTSMSKKSKAKGKKGFPDDDLVPPPTPAAPEPKPAAVEDEFSAFGAGKKDKKKGKKGALTEDPIPEVNDPVLDLGEADNTFDGGFGAGKKDKKKGKKGALTEDPIPETNDPVLDLGEADNTFDWGFGVGKKDKKGKNGLISEFYDNGLLAVPDPPAAPETAGDDGDDWMSSAWGTKKKDKKEKKGGIEDLSASIDLGSTADAKTTASDPPADDSLSAFGTTKGKKDKKGKKGAVVDETPPPPPPAPETPAESDDIWSAFSKKDKKGKKGKFASPEPSIPDPILEVEPEPETAPVEEPKVEYADTTGWDKLTPRERKKKEKEAKKNGLLLPGDEPPAPPPPPQPPAEPEPEFKEDDTLGGWAVSGKDKKSKKKSFFDLDDEPFDSFLNTTNDDTFNFDNAIGVSGDSGLGSYDIAGSPQGSQQKRCRTPTYSDSVPEENPSHVPRAYEDLLPESAGAASITQANFMTDSLASIPSLTTVSFHVMLSEQKALGSFPLQDSIRNALLSGFDPICYSTLRAIFKRRGEQRSEGASGSENEIINTILAVWYIQKIYPEEEGSWELIIRKARTWLARHGELYEDDLNEFFDVLGKYWKR